MWMKNNRDPRTKHCFQKRVQNLEAENYRFSFESVYNKLYDI